MLIIKPFSIIMIFYLLGETLSYIFSFDFPGSIIGMILLFAALNLKIVKIEDVKVVSDFFLKYMPLFFIPAGVSIMSSFGLIEEHLISIVLVIVISTVLMLAFISLLVDFFVKKVEDV